MKFPFSSCILLFLTLLLANCSNEKKTTVPVKDPAKALQDLPFEKRYKREIEEKLNIGPKEKYTLQLYKAYINSDSIEDVIITVNRMQFAEGEAIKSGKTAKSAELGYTGNYNYFFYYDGSLDKISDPVPVPSSPGRPLDVSFISISSPTKKDIVIDYRIRNSGWRSYYTSSGDGTLALMFQWKWFDQIGTENPEALNHVFDPSPEGISQDISIYASSIDNHSLEIKDVYAFVPTITKKGALQFRFFFDPRINKFRIYSPEMLKQMGLTAVGKR